MGLEISFNSKSNKETLEKNLGELSDNVAQNNELINLMRKEMDSLRAQIGLLTSTVEKLHEQVAKLSSKPTPPAPPKPKANDCIEPIVLSDPEPRTPKTPPTPPKPAKRKFYARYSPTQDILSEMPDSMAERASFVAEVSGNSGTVKFNPECTKYALNALSSAIYPFFDYDLKSDSPTSINAVNDVPITHLSGTNWKMDGKIKLILS